MKNQKNGDWGQIGFQKVLNVSLSSAGESIEVWKSSLFDNCKVVPFAAVKGKRQASCS